MSLRRTLLAMPTMLRIGFVEAIAYRAELLVWTLSTTMPLVMLALFAAVAREHPMGRMGEHEMIAYFLWTFFVRQLTGSWIAWQMNFDVREGTLAVRLLRPVHPLFGYATEALGGLPLRALASIPVVVVAFAVLGRGATTHDSLLLALFPVALLGGWLVTFLANLVIGATAMFLESSLKLLDIYLAFFMLLSGYVLPLELFPAPLRAALDWMPFRYAVGLPVELVTGAHTRAAALGLVGRQYAMIVVLALMTQWVWRRGVRRFEAYGS
jgi:ABC-2 type transport system permease protein